MADDAGTSRSGFDAIASQVASPFDEAERIRAGLRVPERLQLIRQVIRCSHRSLRR